MIKACITALMAWLLLLCLKPLHLAHALFYYPDSITYSSKAQQPTAYRDITLRPCTAGS